MDLMMVVLAENISGIDLKNIHYKYGKGTHARDKKRSLEVERRHVKCLNKDSEPCLFFTLKKWISKSEWKQSYGKFSSSCIAK